MQKALDFAYDKAVNGVAGLDSAIELAESYKNDDHIYEQCNSLIRWQNTKAGTSGFVTGLGGLILMPVTLPANVTSVLYVQIRMIAAIAHLAGHDLKDDKVKTMVYVCLVGNSAVEILKNVKQPVKWVHFGDGSSMSDIKLLAKEQLSHHQFEFKGRLENFEDVLKYYIDHTVNLFITTSSTEGMPVTIMEALSFGVPVMATDVGGISEMITDKTGLLLNKDVDIEKATRFIENFKDSVYNTVEKRKEIRAYWEDNFKAEKAYTEFIELLKNQRNKKLS